MKTETLETRLTTSDIPKRYRPFAVKYISPTNFRGGRVKITDIRRGKSKTIPWTHDFNNSADYALNYLNSSGIKVVALSIGDLDSDTQLLTEDFETELK